MDFEDVIKKLRAIFIRVGVNYCDERSIGKRDVYWTLKLRVLRHLFFFNEVLRFTNVRSEFCLSLSFRVFFFRCDKNNSVVVELIIYHQLSLRLNSHF